MIRTKDISKVQLGKRIEMMNFLYVYLLAVSIITSHSPLVEAVSRAYPHGCAHEQPSYYDYDTYPLPPPNLPALSHDDFSLLRRLGAGKFSDVFEAVELSDSDEEMDETIDPSALCVIKVRDRARGFMLTRLYNCFFGHLTHHVTFFYLYTDSV